MSPETLEVLDVLMLVIAVVAVSTLVLVATRARGDESPAASH